MLNKATPPPSYYEPPDCRLCGGNCVVHAPFILAGDVLLTWLEFNCPRCNATGIEPELDPMDDPRIP